MFARKSLGLEIYPDGIRLALIAGSRSKPVVEAFDTAPLHADTIRISLREANILDPGKFVATVRDTHLRLLTKTVRTSVSLPDAAGRVILLDLDTRFKSRDEAGDIIRWKLKKNFPFDINDAHFDFQQVQERETGEIVVLVSLICRQVLAQYEELLAEAGLEPNNIDFTTFGIYELFADRFSLDNDYGFICYFNGVVSVLIFREGALEFYRTKELSTATFTPNRVYREISSSLLVHQDKHPGVSLGKIYCLTSYDQVEEFKGLVAEATSQEPVLLDVERVLSRSATCSTVDRNALYAMSAACGAALRNL